MYLKVYIPVMSRGFAKRTLMKTAKKAGFKTKESGNGGKRQKYLMPTPPMARRMLSATLDRDGGSRPSSGVWDEELSGE